MFAELLCGAVALLLYVNTLGADFCYDDRYLSEWMTPKRTVLYPLTGNLISSVEKRWFTTWRKGAFHCVSIKTAMCLSLQTVRPEAGITVVCALRRSWVMEMSHCFESHCQSPQSRHVLVCDICGSCANISFPCYSWSVSDHSLLFFRKLESVSGSASEISSSKSGLAQSLEMCWGINWSQQETKCASYLCSRDTCTSVQSVFLFVYLNEAKL